MISKLDCQALIIGIDDYSGGFKTLRSAVNDATAVADLLESEHNYSVDRLLNADARGESIKHYLANTLPTMMTERSAFLLYFAGHGDARGDGTEGAQGYLLPHDATKADENTWFSMTDFRELLEGLSCRHLLVILDCCFAGAFRWSATRGLSVVARPLFQSQFERYIREGSWQALTSAAHDELAADAMPGLRDRRESGGTGGHSPFTSALIAGLKGGADSSRGGNKPDGVITATELHQFVFDELTLNASTQHQTPGIWPLKTDNKGEFVFGNPGTDIQPEPDPPLTDDANPWLGLKAYTARDADLFFGRQRVVKALVKRLFDESAPSLLAVVGASGTGKSSVVKAGLFPLLSKQADSNWHVVESPRLAGDPNVLLESSIAELGAIDGHGGRLLFIDQFEELYTQCPDEDSRTRFLQRIRSLVDDENGPTVVLTIRSDFEPRPKGSDAMADLWPAARFVVPAFNIDELREVIEGPANAMALFFDPDDLVSRLLDEVLAMPGALPLLSFALAEMYRHAQLRRRHTGATDRALTEQDYVQAGGVIGALHKRASLLYDESDNQKLRDSIRKLFLRMVSQESGLTRRRVQLRELEFATEEEQRNIDAARKRYVDGRLLIVDDTFIEPAHDTLVVAWDKLRGWLDESGSQQLVRSVWQGASEWQANKGSKNSNDYLWHADPRLQQAVDAFPQLNKLEQSFVIKSEARRKRGRRLLWSGTSAIVAVILGLSVWAYLESQRALLQARQARSEGIAILAHANNDPIRKALLLRELVSKELPEPSAGMNIIHATNWLIREQTVDQVPYTGTAGWDFVDLSDAWVATASITSDLALRYSYEGRIETMSGLGRSVGDRTATVVTLGRPEIRNRDPNPIYAAGFDDGLIAIRTRDRELHTFAADAAISAMAFAKGSDYLLVATVDGTGRFFSVQESAVDMKTIGDVGSPPLVAVALDAQGMVIAMADSTDAVWLLQRDGKSLKPLQEIQNSSGVTALSLSADGSVLAVGAKDGAVAVWRRGRDRWQPGTTLDHGGAAISAVAVSYSGAGIAALTQDYVWLWRDAGREAPVRRKISRQAKLDVAARIRFTQDQRMLHIVTENGAFLRTPVTFPAEGVWGDKISAGVMRWNADVSGTMNRSYKFPDAPPGKDDASSIAWTARINEQEVTIESPAMGVSRVIAVPPMDMPPELERIAQDNEFLTPEVTLSISNDGMSAAVLNGSPIFWTVSVWDLQKNRQLLTESGEGRLRNIWFADSARGVVLGPTTGGANAERYLNPVAYMIDEQGQVKRTVVEFSAGYQPFALFNSGADVLAIWGSHPYNANMPSKLFIWNSTGRHAAQPLASREGIIASVEFDEPGETLRVKWDDGHVMTSSLRWEASIYAMRDSTLACLTVDERAQLLAENDQQPGAIQSCTLR